MKTGRSSWGVAVIALALAIVGGARFFQRGESQEAVAACSHVY